MSTHTSPQQVHHERQRQKHKNIVRGRENSDKPLSFSRRSKFAMVVADEIEPKKRAKDYMDRAACENEIKQLIGSITLAEARPTHFAPSQRAITPQTPEEAWLRAPS